MAKLPRLGSDGLSRSWSKVIRTIFEQNSPWFIGLGQFVKPGKTIRALCISEALNFVDPTKGGQTGLPDAHFVRSRQAF